MVKIGEQIGRYNVRSVIGAGGMGDVFLAEDIELGRLVALKVLPSDVSNDFERVRRFIQEAKSASTLNHPNILTIYEIGESNGLRFMASEYIEGETLRDKLTNESLSLPEIIKITIQIASALQTAHEAGIIHRDIKPENIMLRGDGLVKVLDFGLVKLIEERNSEEISADDITRTYFRTKTGKILGTTAYMSPEQLRGQHVDTRADIWSLGVVLFEMLTGKRPFAGDTSSDLIASVLKTEPPPMLKFAADVPEKLEQLVLKTLQKDREDRYSTNREIISELEELSLEFENEKTEKSPRRLNIATEDKYVVQNTPMARGFTARQPQPAQITEKDFETSATGNKVNRVGLLVLAAFAVLMIGGFGLYKSFISPSETIETFQNMRLKMATTEGNAVVPLIAISPDGKYVAYVNQENGENSLRVKQVATSSELEIVKPTSSLYRGLTFTPDGNYIYYSVDENKVPGVLYKIPVLGGKERKLLENVNTSVTFSSGGNQMAFVREAREIVIAEADGSLPKTISTASAGEAYDYCSWSPNQNNIILSVFSSADSKYHLFDIAITDGTKRRIDVESWDRIAGIDHLSDGSGLIISGRDSETQLSQIWFISSPDGKLRKITNDLSDYFGVSVTADKKTLVSIKHERLANIWVGSGEQGNDIRKITSNMGKDEGMSGIVSVPDGRIVYTVREKHTQNLWIIDKDGSNNQQLTFETSANFTPAVSPDGRYIVFASTHSGSTDLWRMDITGENLIHLTNKLDIETNPNFTPDGEWIFYESSDSKRKTTIWKINIDGGKPVQITDVESWHPIVSPDGKWITFKYKESENDSMTKTALIPVDDVGSIKILDYPKVSKSGAVSWTADGKGLIYIDDSDRVYNLWIQPLDNSAPKQLTNFSSDQIFGFDFSNNQLVLSRGKNDSNVVVINNFE